MFLPGDLVRRAAANVSSTVSSVSNTVSSVASVATGSGRQKQRSVDKFAGQEEYLLANAKEKYNMTLKCTPNKDAATTASLAIKTGFLLKRNEQGVYHKKFICTVPHFFLYYFDSDTSDAPRGIIDLELYSNVTREDNVMKLSGYNEEKLRQFFFEDSDITSLNNWVTSLIRDRYHVVVDERNAYQQMQFEMTGVLDSASIQKKSTEIEKESLEKELTQSNKQFNEALGILQSMLVIVGITEEQMMKLSDVNKIGNALKVGVMEMKSNLEKKYDDSLEALDIEKQSHQQIIEKLEKQIESEQQARRNIEALLLKEKKDSELRLRETMCQVDNAHLNFQMAVASKTEAESKNNTLVEQKKVLVKEVKQLRKKLDESNELIEQLKSLNDRLNNATEAMQEQLRTLSAAKNIPLPAIATNTVTLSENGSDGVTSNATASTTTEQSTTELIAQSNKLLNSLNNNTTDNNATIASTTEENKSPSAAATSTTPSKANETSSFSRLANILFMNNLNALSADDKEKQQQQHDKDAQNKNEHGEYDFELSYNNYHHSSSGGGGSGNYHIHDDEYGGTRNMSDERISWEMPPTQLKELGWLSPEQSKLIDSRMSHHGGDATHRNSESSDGSGSTTTQTTSYSSMFTSLLGGSSSGGHEQHVHSSGSGGHVASSSSSSTVTQQQDQNQQQQSNNTQTGRRTSYFSSMFGSNENATTTTTTQSLLKEKTDDIPSRSVNNSSDSNNNITTTSVDETSKQNTAFFSSPFGEHFGEDESSTEKPTAPKKLRCLRCDGTVEGPKLSTCKCMIPALTPEDLANSPPPAPSTSKLSMFSGMLSKGSTLTGGFMKATTSSVGSLMGNSNNNSGQNTNLQANNSTTSAASFMGMSTSSPAKNEPLLKEDLLSDN